jgi:hypothetical protein
VRSLSFEIFPSHADQSHARFLVPLVLPLVSLSCRVKSRSGRSPFSPPDSPFRFSPISSARLLQFCIAPERTQAKPTLEDLCVAARTRVGPIDLIPLFGSRLQGKLADHHVCSGLSSGKASAAPRRRPEYSFCRRFEDSDFCGVLLLVRGGLILQPLN